MMTPTLPMMVTTLNGYDAYGQPAMGTRWRERCAPVQLNFAVTPSAVQADASASQGHADEGVASVIVLALTTTRAGVNTQVELMGRKLRVTKAIPRYRVTGQLDHYELHLASWG